MSTSTTDHPVISGLCSWKTSMVTALEEKSKQPKSNIINAGAYLFTPEIFDLLAQVGLSSRGELELTDALNDPYWRAPAPRRSPPDMDGHRLSLGFDSMRMRPFLPIFLRKIREL